MALYRVTGTIIGVSSSQFNFNQINQVHLQQMWGNNHDKRYYDHNLLFLGE